MTTKPASGKSKKRGPEQGEARKVAEAAGISRSQMWNWMQMATIPEEEFDAILESKKIIKSRQVVEYARRRRGMAPSPDPAPRLHACPHCGGDLLSTEETTQC